jgi:hypothetical protein
MDFNLWFIVAGVLFVAMALSVTTLRRLPLTTSILYLAVGVALGSAALGALRLDPLGDSELVERVSEVAVIVSLFTAGLKLRLPLRDDRWRLTLRLAFVSMTLTVGLIGAAGVLLLGLPLGAAVLLGAVLAPTDPVLASDVQAEHAYDRDRLRFSQTGEAGLNDGTAFPFVMLGLGLLGLHGLGGWGWRWLAVDVLWAVSGGLAVGGLLGTAVGRYVLHLRREHEEAVGADDFLALGLIALSYGAALLLHSYGFLAVFAAGVALRRVERLHSGDEPPEDVPAAAAEALAPGAATDPERAPAHMAQAVLGFNEQLERIGEVIVVVMGHADPAVPLAGRAVVRAVPAPHPPPGLGPVRARRRPRLAAEAAADRVVRHPRHRLCLLPDLRRQPWPGARDGAPAGRPHTDDHRGLGLRPRRLGHPADWTLREGPGSETRPEARRPG